VVFWNWGDGESNGGAVSRCNVLTQSSSDMIANININDASSLVGVGLPNFDGRREE
jgi:hypothetical protein